MDELEKLLNEAKSLREATTKEVQDVFKRYGTLQAQHATKDAVSEVYLSQQSNCAFEIKTCTIESKELQGLCEARAIKFDEKYKGRVKIYKASDETVDASGDIIRQNGWDFSRFKTNATIQYCHDYYQLPIGSAIKWQVADNALYIHVLFALKEQNDFADTIFRMVDGGFLKGNSVGFVPKKIQIVQDNKERQQLGLGKYGVIFEKQLLLEDSVCPLGCNPAALVQDAFVKSMQGGIVSRDEAERFIKSESTPDSMKFAIDQAITMVNKTLSIEGSDIPKNDPKTKQEKPEEGGFLIPVEDWKTLLTSFQKTADSLGSINTEITTIKTDMADIRSKGLSFKTGDESPEPENKSKDLYDLLTKGIDEVITNINKSNKDN